jgi:multiple sugar transport system ATP-binding protein
VAEIKLTGVNKIYPGGTHAVHDVDLHIADGEFMIMVGPSGCAKSTILRMIAGLEVPTAGTIEIGGRVVNDVAPKDRDIAMVFQSYALYPHMTVRDNMAFGLRLRRMPQNEIDQRVADAARILGLENLLDRLPKAMSGGQRQRVAMGRAIVREPQAFLMDEPLSNLDAKLRVQMRTEIAKLHQRLQTTTVYVTHDQVEALTLGQRICILRKGVIQQVNTPYEVYQNPSNVFVGGFIGSPGMNFMSGHLVLHHGVVFLQLGEHHLPLPASLTSRLLATSTVHGRPVVVGIRPEHFSLANDGDPYTLPVQVELVEAMGSEMYAYFGTNVATPDLSELSDTQATADSFVARLGSGASVRGGERIHLRPTLDEIHLFDPQTMLTLLSPSDEGEVRARQSAAAGAISINTQPHSHVASPTALGAVAPTPVTMPVRAAESPVLQPMQPIIHLHQTFVSPDGTPVGTLAPAIGETVAAVFDQPLPSTLPLEPLMPAAVGDPGHPQASHHPRPTFAQGDGSPPPGRPSQASSPRRSGFPAPAHSWSSDEPAALAPAFEPDVAPALPVAPVAPTAPTAAPVDTGQPATPPPSRGFAPRPIRGVAPSAEPRLAATRAELDAAIEAPLTASVGEDAHAPAPPAAPSGFRAALTDLQRGAPSAQPPASPRAPKDFRTFQFGSNPEAPDK